MNAYRYYYLKVLRPDFLVKYNFRNANSIFKLDEVIIYFYLLNIDRELNDEFLRAAFLLEFLSGQKSFLRGFKFKFKYDSSEVNFYCCVKLHGFKLFDFLSMLYLVFYKSRGKLRYNFISSRYTVSFKTIKSFFNIGLLEEEYFQWNKYLNVNFLFSKSTCKFSRKKFRSIVKSFI